ncbi:MAG: adenosylmethionine decarboxylase [Pseudodesulfovibrio sp.]
MTTIVGEHWIIEFTGCPAEILDDLPYLQMVLKETCRMAKLNLLEAVDHAFTPQGVTALGLLSESHISIHTWPEEGYAAIDIFTCGEKNALDIALDNLVSTLKPDHHTCKIIKRGPQEAK